MKKLGWGALLLLLLLAIVILADILWRQEDTFSFPETEKTVNNPNRGCYIQIDSSESDRVEKIEAEGLRLMFLALELKEYRDEDIPQEKLEELEACLREAKDRNISVIFRAAYGFDGDCEEPSEKELFQVHIRQIAEVINPYKDLIYCVQAGMLGPWGEWHSSMYLSEDDEEMSEENRLYILRQWEKYLDADITVNVRRPRFIREAEEAGVLVGRLGFHDDGLLSSESDLGTYDDPDYDRDGELAWMDKNLKHQVNGGEMARDSEYNDAEAADAAFRSMHISYLNLHYNRDVFEKWRDQTVRAATGSWNAEQYIQNRVGYRLDVTELSIAYHRLNPEVKLGLTFQGEGYAPLPKQYHVYLARTEEGQTEYLEIPDQDIAGLCCGEKLETTIALEAGRDLREKLLAGTVKLGLKIAESPEEADVKKCVELGNDGVEFVAGINYFQIAQVSGN